MVEAAAGGAQIFIRLWWARLRKDTSAVWPASVGNPVQKTVTKGRVWGVYVTASNRGQGLSRNMMKLLLERAAASDGLEQVLLSVRDPKTAAFALYRSSDLSRSARSRNRVSGVRRS